jgi:sortase (surface protein transpeptidase)
MDLLYLLGTGFGLIIIGRLIYTSGPLPDGHTRRRLHRWSRRLLFVLAVMLVLGCTGYWGYLQRVAVQEAASPSTEQVLVLANGQRIPLVQPGEDQPREVVSAGNAEAGGQEVVETPGPAPHLPPTRLRIPEIDLDARVILADVDALPKAAVVAWIDGTAFPGAPGNMVLYGYQSGPYKTFLHLGELSAGNEIRVLTSGPQPREILYRVRSVTIVVAGDVVLLAPTSSPIATLITDVPGAPERRLAVIADLIP